jgi:hypothetical protein
VSALFSREAALRVSKRAVKHGVPAEIAKDIALACSKENLRYALGYAMFEQESNFEAIYGHDAGGLNPGAAVTRDNYRDFRKEVLRRKGGGANGVGLGQVTYWTYIRDNADLWKPKKQVYLATSILADYVHTLGEFEGVGAYNGGPSNPNETYARQVLDRANTWRPRLAG